MKIGVLLLENTHLHGPGAMANPASYPAPVMFETLEGVLGRELIDAPAPRLPAFVHGARRLVARGARLVVANCGFAMALQEASSRAVPVPVALSGLTLLPVLRACYGARVAVLTYDAAALARAWRGFGLGALPPHAGVETCPEWRLLECPRPARPDPDRLYAELEMVARRLVAVTDPGVLLVECTGMLPFTAHLASRLGIPVMGVFHLIRMLSATCHELNEQNVRFS